MSKANETDQTNPNILGPVTMPSDTKFGSINECPVCHSRSQLGCGCDLVEEYRNLADRLTAAEKENAEHKRVRYENRKYFDKTCQEYIARIKELEGALQDIIDIRNGPHEFKSMGKCSDMWKLAVKALKGK